jgi:hypothetical protein
MLLLAGVLMITQGCADDWLTPKALSFYTPENTFVDAKGMQAGVIAAERNMRHAFYGDAAPILTEYILADIAVDGTTDRPGAPIDLDAWMLPTNRMGTNDMLNHQDGSRIGWWWREQYRGIANANIIITRIDAADWNSEAERNNILGAALFQRAWRFYNLVHQFGNVPWVGEEISSPKLDFYTYDRWSILEKLKTDMEFAAQWVAESPARGHTTKAGAQMLLMKIYMALGEFDKAITVGNVIVAKHPLMTARFSSAQNEPRTNLMHDLHSIPGREFAGNTEGLMWLVSNPAEVSQGSARIETMRNAVPFWAWGVRVYSIPGFPAQAGMQPAVPSGEVAFSPLDMGKYGRGIGRMRSTAYYTTTIWTDKEQNDMRGIFSTVSNPSSPDYGKRDSWRFPEDLVYNHQNLRNHTNPDIRKWWGQPVQLTPMTLSDSIRAWYPWPHYKVWVPDPLDSGANWRGGSTPWYLYRSAETYLMLAECYYWLDRPADAVEMLNVVRRRAGADPLTAADINIGTILDERARELYYEEMRKSEITRIAYTYARTGRPCSVFGGRVYSLANFSGPGGVNSNVKQAGINFFFDWVSKVNNFYNNPVKVTTAGTYTMSVHHVLWPVPDTAIDANTLGRINQNVGYPGAENNMPLLTIQ